MVAGVLRFCWQDDTLGGPMARHAIFFSVGRTADLPLTCSFAPQLSVAGRPAENFWSSSPVTVDSRVITVM